MKTLTKSISDTTSTLSQEDLIPAYKIYHKVFWSKIENKRITTNVYEIQTSLENAPILKIILYKASQHANHPKVQFIPYRIQGITNRDTYKIIIQTQNTFIKYNSIILVYNIEERDVEKM